MSRVRKLGLLVLLAVVVASAATGCSDDEGGSDATSNDRPAISFSDAPEGSTDLGLCAAYELEQMKEIIGGDESFKRLPPAAIGNEGDAVTGEACAWERVEENGDLLTVRIEVRNFGEDTEGAAARYAELEADAVEPEPVADMGEGAFVTVTDDSSILQSVQGGYLLTLASRSAGTLEPLSTDTLKLLGTAGLERLP